MTGRRRPWKALLALLVAGATFRFVLCVELTVPSGSMEPALHGDPLRGDELLVWKFAAGPFAPGRFDLVVFERRGDDVKSAERVNVKRVAGLGGESLRIDDGDLYVREAGGDERRLVKSYAEFRPLLVPLARSGAVTRRIEAGAEVALAEEVAFDDGWLDRHGVRHAGSTPVSDLLFELPLTIESRATTLRFGFTLAGGVRFDFTLAARAAGSELTIARTLATSAASEERRFPVAALLPDRELRLEFWQIDGEVGAALDGAVLATAAFGPAETALSAGRSVGGVTLSALVGAVTLRGSSVWRDLFWTSPADAPFACGSEPFDVPAGSWFVLGDHSEQSVDSRFFGAVSARELVGRVISTRQIDR